MYFSAQEWKFDSTTKIITNKHVIDRNFKSGSKFKWSQQNGQKKWNRVVSKSGPNSIAVLNTFYYEVDNMRNKYVHLLKFSYYSKVLDN